MLVRGARCVDVPTPGGEKSPSPSARRPGVISSGEIFSVPTEFRSRTKKVGRRLGTSLDGGGGIESLDIEREDRWSKRLFSRAKFPETCFFPNPGFHLRGHPRPAELDDIGRRMDGDAPRLPHRNSLKKLMMDGVGRLGRLLFLSEVRRRHGWGDPTPLVGVGWNGLPRGGMEFQGVSRKRSSQARSEGSEPHRLPFADRLRRSRLQSDW